VSLPPLRERKEDIAALVEHFLVQFSERFGRHIEATTPESFSPLIAHDWPGNVRELRNVIEAFVAELAPQQLSSLDIPARLLERLRPTEAPASERDRLLEALSATRWNKSRAAHQLGWSRMTLYRKMARHGVVAGAAALPTDSVEL
jgi:DNA-binding NtrC family response regulator